MQCVHTNGKFESDSGTATTGLSVGDQDEPHGCWLVISSIFDLATHQSQEMVVGGCVTAVTCYS